MDQVYALGVSSITYIQDWFKEDGEYFEAFNHLSNPHHVFEILFPLLSIIDSVFASQLLLCISFGSWLNVVMKWWLLEDRPYWWIRETTFYNDSERPKLKQTLQTCETGPGSPSGHTTTMAMVLVLAIMWITHVMNDRQCYKWWWKHVIYPLFATLLSSVMLARLFVATHFPHQCMLGAGIGLFVAPALCIYISDPYIWRYGHYKDVKPSSAIKWHTFGAASTIVIAVGTYFGLKMSGFDPQRTVKLAFRWCENSKNIHVSTTPMFALAQATGSLMGWALCVTPSVAKYRHYTKDRSLLIAIFSAGFIVYIMNLIEENLCKANTLYYYCMYFVLCALKCISLLRLGPALAMWPYSDNNHIKTD